jgi:hypothetical protein
MSTIVPNRRFYFWTGNSKPKTAISDWQAKLKKLFDPAKVAGGHADRFRDTFATELLLGWPVPSCSGHVEACRVGNEG